MKFAHEFQAALLAEGFPEHWVASAVHYRQLKKVIKKVTDELRSLGLDSATLARLLPPETTTTDLHGRRGGGVASFQYEFNGNKTEFHPRLTIFVENGLPVDASLSPDTKNHLRNLVLQQGGTGPSSLGVIEYSTVQEYEQTSESVPDTSAKKSGIQQIEVPLKFDSQFFKTIQQEVSVLEALQSGEQGVLTNEIVALSHDVTTLSKPSRFSKSDMNRWRDLFAIYLDANIFFSTHELDHGRRDSATATRQLQWFQSEVVRKGLQNSFKLPASHEAFKRFVHINKQLLLNIKFQEINQKAIYKILKKFDKRTQLHAAKALPSTIQPGSVMPEAMAKAVCSQLSRDLVSVVPQFDDFACPLCCEINWRPVKLVCGHLICISCAVNMQQLRDRQCPFCRHKGIMTLDEGNIDIKLEDYLEKHFPKEVRVKRIKVETERGKQQ
ncbi:putative RING finger protein [Lachnellula occidentalis]|uniref:Putative RING finger protein n=1 Tax=Lachnellula occidentalis TaxID=215460 RepID=A0A8H8UG66_9HELO|nr:putative RING finger protein [Lachnellula occidentalis]